MRCHGTASLGSDHMSLQSHSLSKASQKKKAQPSLHHRGVVFSAESQKKHKKTVFALDSRPQYSVNKDSLKLFMEEGRSTPRISEGPRSLSSALMQNQAPPHHIGTSTADHIQLERPLLSSTNRHLERHCIHSPPQGLESSMSCPSLAYENSTPP